MTQEQYKRAVDINTRLNQLEDVKRKIADKDNFRLDYVYKEDDGIFYPLDGLPIYYLKEKLAIHDRLIRKEIDEEIEALKKEIETL